MTFSDDENSINQDYSFITAFEPYELDIHPAILNEREKIQGIDPLLIIKQINEMLGTGEVSDVPGWDLRKESKEISCWTRWSGTELRQDIGCVRATHRFPNVDDPARILKAINDERHMWNDAYDSVINTDFRSKNSLV